MGDHSGKHVYIITGTSKGIGEAIAQKLLQDENEVICISRNQNPRLGVQARLRNFSFRDLEVDLSQPAKIKEVMKVIFRDLEQEKIKSISLLNNAGTVKPIRELGTEDNGEQISQAVNLNLLAPFLLSDMFIRYTRNWEMEKRILNISTGAAARPVHGWSVYCTTKSGLEMLSQCIAEEQKGKQFPVKVVSFSPGMVDTEMQSEIRAATAEIFPELNRFVQAKEKGELLDPYFVADKMVALLQNPDFGKELHLHIRQMS